MRFPLRHLYNFIPNLCVSIFAISSSLKTVIYITDIQSVILLQPITHDSHALLYITSTSQSWKNSRDISKVLCEFYIIRQVFFRTFWTLRLQLLFWKVISDPYLKISRNFLWAILAFHFLKWWIKLPFLSYTFLKQQNIRTLVSADR